VKTGGLVAKRDGTTLLQEVRMRILDIIEKRGER